MSRAEELETIIYNKLSTASIVEPNRAEYRFSGSMMPVCPRLMAIQSHKSLIRKQTPKSDSVLSNGVTNHSIIQKWLASSGILFGKFKDYAGNIYPFPQYKSISKEEENKLIEKGKIIPKYDVDSYNWVGTTGPLYNKDKTLMEYVEMRVYDKKCGFTGLIDAIIKLPSWSKYAICDFKFVGPGSFEHFKNEGVGEVDSYRYQLNSYLYNANKFVDAKGNKIPIYDKGYLIIMRDDFIRNMSLSNIMVLPIKYEPEMYKEQRKLFLKAKSKIESRDFDYFCNKESAVCSSVDECGFCKGKYICFGTTNSKKYIKDILKEVWGKQ